MSDVNWYDANKTRLRPQDMARLNSAPPKPLCPSRHPVKKKEVKKPSGPSHREGRLTKDGKRKKETPQAPGPIGMGGDDLTLLSLYDC
jgi:hypothetical protein